MADHLVGDESDDEPGVPPYAELTIVELRDELRSRGLPVSGSKEELMVRLAEAETVDELKEDLREADLPVSGPKDELVERVTGVPTADSGKVEVRAGGFVAMADPPPPTPPPIDICSVCGRNPHECSHSEPSGWTVAPEEE